MRGFTTLFRSVGPADEYITSDDRKKYIDDDGSGVFPIQKVRKQYNEKTPLPSSSIFLYFVHHGARFYDKYITSDDRNKYIDDDGSGVFPKQKVRKLYNAKCKNTY